MWWNYLACSANVLVSSLQADAPVWNMWASIKTPKPLCPLWSLNSPSLWVSPCEKSSHGRYYWTTSRADETYGGNSQHLSTQYVTPQHKHAPQRWGAAGMWGMTTYAHRLTSKKLSANNSFWTSAAGCVAREETFATWLDRYYVCLFISDWAQDRKNKTKQNNAKDK